VSGHGATGRGWSSSTGRLLSGIGAGVLALQDALFQDKGYEGLLHMRTPLPRADADGWFEEFGNIPPREPRRGVRR